jgi:hypothetical protein
MIQGDVKARGFKRPAAQACALRICPASSGDLQRVFWRRKQRQEQAVGRFGVFEARK